MENIQNPPTFLFQSQLLYSFLLCLFPFIFVQTLILIEIKCLLDISIIIWPPNLNSQTIARLLWSWTYGSWITTTCAIGAYHN